MTKALQRVPELQLMLKEKQFRAIGHMVVQWAYLESEINREISWLLSRSEHKSKHVNFRARFSTRMTNWEKLTQRTYKKHPSRIKAVQRIIGRANKIKIERDDLVHGNFSSKGTFFKIRDGKIFDIFDTVGTPPHIEDLACRISEISAKLFRHHVALRRHFRRGRPRSRKSLSPP